MTQINSRIKQKHDTLANWTSNNIVLLVGELAVVDCGNQTKFKVGNGLSTFNQLPFIDQEVLSTKWVAANAISQGIHAKSVPYGLAAGAYLSAGANFSQALGYNAAVLSADQYAFAWNGNDQNAIGDYYASHGKGTFNINPLSGTEGVFIGENSLCSILKQSGNRIFVDNRISGISEYSDLSVIKLAFSEYIDLLFLGQLLSNSIYVVEDTCENAYGEQIKNVAPPTDLSDAATKEYVDALVDEKSAVSVDNVHADINVVHIAQDDYAHQLADDSILSNAIYVVSSEYENAYGQQMKNLAPGTDLSDAVNLEQLSNAIDSIQIPIDLSSFTNSPGYLVSNDISAELSTLSSTVDQKSQVTFVDWDVESED